MPGKNPQRLSECEYEAHFLPREYRIKKYGERSQGNGKFIVTTVDILS